MTAGFARRFLVEPELFPARIAGAAWGSGTCCLPLPTGPCLLTGLSPVLESRARQRFGSRPAPAAAVATVRLFQVEEREFRPIDTAGWELAIDLDPADDALRLCSLGWMGRIEGLSGGPTAAGVWTWRDDDGFDGVLENLLRALVAYQALAADGLMLHSAAVVDGAEASVFAGRSGAGKSTLSRLSLAAGHQISSDDLNVLLPEAGGWTVAPAPFGGDFRPAPGTPLRYDLRRLLTLAQGSGERLDPLSPSLAFAALFACAPFVNRDPYRLEALSRNLRALLDLQPVLQLTFAREGDPWRLLT